MKNNIHGIIDELYERYMKNPPVLPNYGICKGEVGIAYLCSIMYDETNESRYKEWSSGLIKYLLLKNEHIEYSSLGYGKAGVYWLLSITTDALKIRVK